MLHTRDKLMILVMMIGGFCGSLRQNMLTSALPAIMADLQVNAFIGQWLTTSYILVLGIITAVSAWLFFQFTVRQLEIGSLMLFFAGCVAAFLAPDFSVLLIARIIQACGAGITIPLLQIVLLYLFPKEMQGRAMALTGIIVGFAPALGPTLAGVLTDTFGWRSIFLFLLALSGSMVAAGFFAIHNVGKRHSSSLDAISLELYAVGFTAFMLGIGQLDGQGGLVRFTALLLLGILALALFCIRQTHRESPLLKIGLLKIRSVSAGTLLLGLSYILMMSGTVLVPLYIQTIGGHSATLSGLILLPGALLIAFLSPLSGKLSDSIGARRVCIIGMVILSLGCLGFVFFSAVTSAWLVTLFYAVRSIGLAFLITSCTTLAVEGVTLEDKPHASAILNSLRQMTGALFTAVLVQISVTASTSSTLDMQGMHVTFCAMTAIAALGIILALVTPPRHLEIK